MSELRFIRLSEVKNRTGLSKTEIYRRIPIIFAASLLVAFVPSQGSRCELTLAIHL